jgi:hypothetical protein
VTQPSDEWLQKFGAQLAVATARPGTVVAPPPVPAPMPVPAPTGGPSISWLSKGAGLLDVPPQAPPNDPFGLMAPQPATPPAAAPAGPQAPAEATPPDPRLMPPTGVTNLDAIPQPQPQAPQPAPADVQFRGVGGGVLPAHEADVRGPRQNQHLMQSFEAPLAVADRMDLRSSMAAQREADEYAMQAEAAMQREEAAQKVQLQRQAQMERLAMEYEDSVQQLGQMKLDDNRWWANKSTPDKIGTAILAFVGGLAVFDPKGDGRNLAYEAIMREADRDIEAQKFDYMVKGEQAKGAHNAFAMAMDRFHNEDAAAGVARAAAIDYSLARLGKVQAEWKGVESQNAADELRAKLLSERERTIAAGIQFVPAKAAGGGYQMIVRGQVIPGLVSEKEAQRIALEHGVKPAERTDDILTKGGVDVAIERGKAAGKAGDQSVEGAKDIAHQMQTAGIPKMRALTQAALAAMADDEGGKGEAATRALVSTLVPFVGEAAANGIMSDKANAREQALQAFANLNMNQLSGGAISPSEEGRLKKQLGSAGDPAARRRALTTVMTQLDAAEKNIKAPYVGTGAAERYDAGAGTPQRGAAKSLTFHGK